MTLKPKLYGLVGFPIKHSLSPCMHNAAFAALKIKARYELFERQPDQLEHFLKDLKKRNICGFNVTIPYKEKILSYLNLGVKSLGVRMIGAVNTVVIESSGRLKGFNTDYPGFSRHLKELKVEPRKVALIGAGGAAKAVCFVLAKTYKVEEICVYDIDNYKSLGLVSRFKDTFDQTKFSVVARVDELNLPDKDLLVNTSPVGMRPDDHCLVAAKAMHPKLFVYDVIYNPGETKLIGQAKQAGCRCSNGLGMLLYQGVLAFGHLTGKEAPIEVMRAALEKGVKKL
jgi:shikimate dehydrogenase